MYRHIFPLSVIIAFSQAAAAQTSITQGWYVGGALGLTKLDISEKEEIRDFNNATSSMASAVEIDDDGAAVRGVVGRKLSSFLAIEGGYAELDSYEADFDTGSGATTSEEVDARALFLGAQLFTAHENRWAAYVKGGVARWKLSGDRDNNTSKLISNDEDGFDPYYGAGVSRKYLDAGRINFGVERFTIDDNAIDSLSIEFIAQF